MQKIIITTDSTADLTDEMLKERDIRISSLHVLLGEKEYTDRVDITPQTIFDFVAKEGILPKTSAVSEGEFSEFFEKNLEGNDYIIHFDISSGISSTYSNAVTAAKAFGGRVAVIDTRQLSTGQGLLALKASDMVREGKTFEEIVPYVRGLAEITQTSFVIDSLDYLSKGGRCTSVAAFASKILKIHPSIKMEDGTLSVKKKYIGSLKRCIGLYVDDLAAEYTSYDDTRVFITHTCCSADIVDFIREKIESRFHFKEIIETIAGSVITSHCGRGTLGVLFIKK